METLHTKVAFALGIRAAFFTTEVKAFGQVHMMFDAARDSMDQQEITQYYSVCELIDTLRTFASNLGEWHDPRA